MIDDDNKTVNLDDIYCICETSTGVTHIGVLLEFEYYGLSLHKPMMIMIGENDSPYLDEPMFVGSSDGYLTYSDNTPYTLFTPNDYFKSMYMGYDSENVTDDIDELENNLIISDTVH